MWRAKKMWKKTLPMWITTKSIFWRQKEAQNDYILKIYFQQTSQMMRAHSRVRDPMKKKRRDLCEKLQRERRGEKHSIFGIIYKQLINHTLYTTYRAFWYHRYLGITMVFLRNAIFFIGTLTLARARIICDVFRKWSFRQDAIYFKRIRICPKTKKRVLQKRERKDEFRGKILKNAKIFLGAFSLKGNF